MSSESKAAEPAPAGREVAELGKNPPAINSAEALREVLRIDKADVFCSFDVRTREGMMLQDRCEEAADARVKSMVNLNIEVVHVYAKDVDLVDKKTGEVKPATRICLVDGAGKVFACTADGVRKSIARLSSQHGIPPWLPAVRVRVELKDIGDGKQWLTLLNDPLPIAERGKK